MEAWRPKDIFHVQKFPEGIDMNELMTLKMTSHGQEVGVAERIRKSGESIMTDEVLDTFRVDQGHPAGPELHLVSREGHVFILNMRKYLSHKPCVVTMLNARPAQVERLYRAVGEKADPEVLKACRRNVDRGLNR